MIASHDTMTYLKPKYSIFRLFRWVYQTQTNPWWKQKADILDLRVRWDSIDKCWRFAHGIVMFKRNDVIECIKHMLSVGLYVRIIHEDTYIATKAYREAMCKKFITDFNTDELKKNSYIQIISSKKEWTEVYNNIPYTTCIECFWKFRKKHWFPSPKYWWNKAYRGMFEGFKQLEDTYNLTIWSDFL